MSLHIFFLFINFIVQKNVTSSLYTLPLPAKRTVLSGSHSPVFNAPLSALMQKPSESLKGSSLSTSYLSRENGKYFWKNEKK